MSSNRIIMHIDMNAFFASVEQQGNPELRGKPIAVIGSAKRTVITTSSYEARAYGVKTGMATWEARQKCPHIIFVIGDNRKYTYTSAQMVKLMMQFTPLVEVFSIDEAFLDVTGSLKLFGSAERIAFLLKARIRHELGLTCSIGIAPNKLLAKLASEMQKPDGLTIIAPDRVTAVLERMPIKELCGIGRKVEKQLNDLNIFTCGELGRFPVERLKRRFGINGERLSLMGQGIDDAPVLAPEGTAARPKNRDISRPRSRRLPSMQAIEAANDISPAIVAGGYAISLITILTGLLLFMFSAIVWFLYRTILTKIGN